MLGSAGEAKDGTAGARTTRAAVRVEIKVMLDSGLPEHYMTELFEQKCGVLFQHVLELFPETRESVSVAAG